MFDEIDDEFEEIDALAGRTIEVDERAYRIGIKNLSFYLEGLKEGLKHLKEIRKDTIEDLKLSDQMTAVTSEHNPEKIKDEIIQAIDAHISDAQSEVDVINDILDNMKSAVVNVASGNIGSDTTKH